MSDSKICPHCGMLMVEYTFTFCKGLAGALSKAADADQPFQTCTIGLNFSQRLNVTKLRYWGLIKKVKLKNDKRRGWWQLTDLGKDFIRGKVAIRKQVVTSRNKVVRFEGPEIYIHGAQQEFLFREDYKDMARSQL